MNSKLKEIRFTGVLLSALLLLALTAGRVVHADGCPTVASQTFIIGMGTQTWTLTFESCGPYGANTKACYTLSSDAGTATLSHFVIALCAELQDALLSVTFNGVPVSFSTGPDPTTGVNGVKVGDAAPGTYCFTFSGQWACGCTTVAMKQGSRTDPQQLPIQGVICEEAQGCVIEAPPDEDLGCNPPTLPACGTPTVTGCVVGEVTCTSGPIVEDGCNRSQTFTYSAMGCDGVVCTDTQTFTWKEDTTPPVLHNLPEGGDLGCNPTPPSCDANVTATDDCDGAVDVTCTPGPVIEEGCQRTQTFTYSATDSCGNQVSQSVTYTWKVDTTPPVLHNLPEGGDLGCNPTPPSCDANVTATDDCDGAVDVTCTPEPVESNGCQRSQTFTYSATDSCGNQVSQSVTYTWVEDNTVPTISGCPEESIDLGCNPTPPTCEDAKALVSVSDNCDTEPVLNCEAGPVEGEGCQKSQTFTLTATDACGNTSDPCLVTYTWIEDNTPPEITCPQDITVLLACGETGTIVSFDLPTATDNCDPAPSVSCDPPSGSFFNCGETTVTCTATDACGNESICTFTVTVLCPPCEEKTICKFEDVNGNGILDPGEPPLAGVQIVVCFTTGGLPPVCTTYTTGPDGCVNVQIPNDPAYTVTICEVTPSTTNPNCRWIQTLPNASTPGAVLVDGQWCYQGTGDALLNTTLLFGNICVCPPTQGRTPGFWSNKNGQQILSKKDPAWRTLLNGYCLRTATGTDFDVSTTATFSTAYGSFRTWLLGGNATNMAYMLSVQLAATALNVNFGTLDGNAVIVLPAALAACWGSPTAKINDVIATANAALCADGYTPAGDPNRAFQECLKDILDGINNNLFPISQAASCGVVYP